MMEKHDAGAGRWGFVGAACSRRHSRPTSQAPQLQGYAVTDAASTCRASSFFSLQRAMRQHLMEFFKGEVGK